MSQTVLIAGGSGLIGDELSARLISLGFKVSILGRGNAVSEKVQHYKWDPGKQEMDLQALKRADFVINLAGANVGKGKWTTARKKVLTDSRIDSTQLLIKTIINHQLPVKKFIQASAIGYYGIEGDQIHVETDPPGKDFLATLTEQWENATADLIKAGIPLVILRIGVVLSPKGGALVEMTKPVKLLAGNYLGSGKQIVPWIHMDDMISICIQSITNDQLTGIYNCVAPEPVNNKMLTKKIAQAVQRPAWPFGVPSFVLRLLLGEQAQIVLKGAHISGKKLQDSGFVFQYPTLDKAIKDLFSKTDKV